MNLTNCLEVHRHHPPRRHPHRHRPPPHRHPRPPPHQVAVVVARPVAAVVHPLPHPPPHQVPVVPAGKRIRVIILDELLKIQ